MPFRSCPKCHKVFYWLLDSQVEYWCPNCFEWRQHNRAEEDQGWQNNKDIILQRIPELERLTETIATQEGAGTQLVE